MSASATPTAPPPSGSGSRAARSSGAGGSPGRYDVPVNILVKSDSTTIASRSRRMSVVIPAGDTQGSFTFVEEGIVVPARDASVFEIEVGLGSGNAAAAPRRRTRG